MDQESTIEARPAAGRRPIRVLELRSVRGVGGGPEKTILAGAALADRARVDVTVCYLRAKDDPLFDVHRRAQELGLDYVEIRERHSFDPTIVRTLRTLVRERDVDIVHAHDYKTDLLALVLGRLEHVVPLTTVHGWTGQTTPERWLYYPGDKLLLRAFPRLIAVSSQIRDELIRTGTPAEAIRVVLNGIDPALFRRQRELEESARQQVGLSREHVVVGGVGRLEPQKRFDVLLRAFARASHDKPGWRLLIAVSLHHALDLFVQSSDYEGTSNAVLEAMALETPTVATNVGGTAELIEDGVHGRIVPPDDVAALGRTMLEVGENRDFATRISRAARERVIETLSFSRRTRRVEAIYEELATCL
jgi:glycosyltransferase involved in cell wall biosynthesis